MNRDDFLNMVEDKVTLNRHMIGEVYELIDIFPYFQSAHMLLLKGLQNTKDVKFENQLRNSAVHIADREVLYYFLRTKPASGSGNVEAIKEGGRKEEEIKVDHQQTVIESAKNSEQLITEIEKDFDSPTQISNSDETQTLQSHQILISPERDFMGSDEVMMMSYEEPAPDEEKIFYMDPGFSVPEQGDLLELDDESANVEEVITGSPVTLAGKTASSDKLTQSALIDKFILENPRIEPFRNAEITPQEDISKPFIENEGGFVTETLAGIYINQGYFSKAIDIYEKLSLKFPEKSSYFASQIELIKIHLNK